MGLCSCSASLNILDHNHSLRTAQERVSYNERRLEGRSIFYEVAKDTLETKCQEHGDKKCGSVCALGMTLNLKQEAFSVNTLMFPINLCGYKDQSTSCKFCFDGDRCGKLCAYGGINCQEAWEKGRKDSSEPPKYLLNPFRSSAFCIGGDKPQCPLLGKKEVDMEKSFSEVDVSKDNCRKGGWSCKSEAMFQCTCTEENNPCAIKDDGGEQNFKCTQANDCCHKVELLGMSAGTVRIAKCPIDKRMCQTSR